MGDFINDLSKADHVAEIVKAIAHPLRLRILACLKQGDHNVKSLTVRLGISQPHASYHLRILRLHGLLTDVRRGSEVQYRLARPRLKELASYLEGCPD
jgi:ArsR family transcriptional regulator